MIALYPGAFKPPHKGHFEVVKSLLDGSYNGSIYNKDDYKEKGAALLGGSSKDKPSIDKVIVFVGGGERNGLTKKESMAVWQIYAKHLKNVFIVDGQKNPMFASKDYAQANSDSEFVAVTGIRGQEDFVDLRRVTTYKNAPNVQGLALSAAKGSRVSATDFRKALLSGNLDQIRDFFPKELYGEEILKILNMLKSSIVSEQINAKLESVMNGMFITEDIESLDELPGSTRGAHIAPRATTKSADRAQLVTLYKRVKGQIGSSNVNVKFMQDHIRISVSEGEEVKDFQYSPFMGSILEYMLDQKMNISPLPEIKIKKDVAEAASVFGRTAYYNPELKEVVLYTEGRHPKDVLRSFVHEMVHHIQNNEGRLKSYGTTNTNEDESLVEIEKEAYMLGNITFRNWEDKVKNQ